MFLAFFHLLIKGKNTTSVLPKIMVKSCGVLQQQFIKEVNGDDVNLDVKQLVVYVNGYKQSKGENVGGGVDVSLYNVIGMVVLNPCNVMDPLVIVGVWIPKEQENLDL